MKTLKTEKEIRRRDEDVAANLRSAKSLYANVKLLDKPGDGEEHEFAFALKGLDQAIHSLGQARRGLAHRLGEMLLVIDQ